MKITVLVVEKNAIPQPKSMTEYNTYHAGSGSIKRVQIIKPLPKM